MSRSIVEEEQQPQRTKMMQQQHLLMKQAVGRRGTAASSSPQRQRRQTRATSDLGGGSDQQTIVAAQALLYILQAARLLHLVCVHLYATVLLWVYPLIDRSDTVPSDITAGGHYTKLPEHLAIIAPQYRECGPSWGPFWPLMTVWSGLLWCIGQLTWWRTAATSTKKTAVCSPVSLMVARQVVDTAQSVLDINAGEHGERRIKTLSVYIANAQDFGAVLRALQDLAYNNSKALRVVNVPTEHSAQVPFREANDARGLTVFVLQPAHGKSLLAQFARESQTAGAVTPSAVQDALPFPEPSLLVCPQPCLVLQGYPPWSLAQTEQYQSGKQCDQYAPCCGQGGYCYNTSWTCLKSEQCDVSASYQNACIDKPMCKSFREEFDNATHLVNKYSYAGNPDDQPFWIEFPGPDYASVENGNLVLTMKWNDKTGAGQGPTVISTRWAQYGTFSARLKVAPGQGFVTSFITKSSLSMTEGDEIDFEMLGANPNQVQTNFYWNGQLDYTKGKFFNLPNGGSTTNDYHVYTIDWQADAMHFSVDGNVLRTVTTSDVNNKYPSQTSRVSFSLWDAGCNQPNGTVVWAGGASAWCSDASKRSQTTQAFVDWIEVKCATEDPNPTSNYVPKFVTPPPDVVVAQPGSGSDPNGASPWDPSMRKSAGPGTSGNAGDIIGSGAEKIAAAVVGAALVAVLALTA
ncbi:putative glycosidase CRH2 [Sorochytrium milnesiophthora]